MKQKVCEVKKWDDRYTWNGCALNNCVMSVALDKQISTINLHELIEDKKLTRQQYDSIRKFDVHDGDEYDLKIIKDLASTLKIKIEVV